MPLSISLSEISDQAIKDRLLLKQQRQEVAARQRLEKASLARARLEEERVRKEIQDDLSRRLLLLSLAGTQNLSIECPTPHQRSAIRDGLFSAGMSNDEATRLEAIVRTRIPGKLDRIRNEIHYLQDQFEEECDGLLAYINDYTSITVEGLLARIEALRTELRDIYWRETKFPQLWREVREKFDRYLAPLRPRLPRILSAQQAFLDRLASSDVPMPVGGVPSPDRIIVSEVHLRRLLEKEIPSLPWDQISLSKAELQLIFATVTNDWSLERAASELLTQYPEYKRLHALQLLRRTEEDLPDPRPFFDSKRRVERVCKDVESLCTDFLKALDKYGINCSAKLGDHFILPVKIALGPRNSYYTSARFMLSEVGRSNLIQLQYDLRCRASAGFKNVIYEVDSITSGFTLQKRGCEIMRFNGDLDHYLLAWNHPDGFGLGYEVVTTRAGKCTLKLCWE